MSPTIATTSTWRRHPLPRHVGQRPPPVRTSWGSHSGYGRAVPVLLRMPVIGNSRTGRAQRLVRALAAAQRRRRRASVGERLPLRDVPAGRRLPEMLVRAAGDVHAERLQRVDRPPRESPRARDDRQERVADAPDHAAPRAPRALRGPPGRHEHHADRVRVRRVRPRADPRARAAPPLACRSFVQTLRDGSASSRCRS